jgi:pimeloyl-ACP methyl ester carboxylesterase
MNSLKSLVVVIVIWCISNIKSSQALSFDDYPKLGLVVTSANSLEKIDLKNLYTLPNHPNFNQNFKTVLYGYGYTQYFEEATVQTIMKAYHKRGGYNFLVIDWSSYNSGDYFQTRDNLTDIGKLFGRKFYEMELESNYTLKVNKFHFVGHSMGAHLVAKIARSFFKASNLANLKIEHITALDPAGIGFYDPINSIFQAPLQKNDGKEEQNILKFQLLCFYF